MHRLLASGLRSGVIANSCMERGMAETPTIETLRIARIGHRGDAIAETPEGGVYVPF